VIGDVSKLKTIVGNFISNAIKYAPASPIQVSVECEDADDGLVNALIAITDHGPGIPAEEQELIFQKFVRGSNAKQAKVAGTGIGLAACRALARTLGGNVGVESTPGVETTFHVWVPLRRAPEGAVGKRAEIAPVGRGEALIVEDEEYNRVVMRATAEALGYRAQAAANATEAFALIDGNDFDLMLFDWDLAGGATGPDIARAVRRRPEGAKAIILAVTAHDSDQVRRICQDAGMDGFVLKPVDVETLGQVIQHARVAWETRTNAATNAPVRVRLNFRALNLHAQQTGQPPEAAPVRFVASVEQERETLRRGFADTDLPAVATAAHRLRGLAGLVGATELSQAARALDEAARTGKPHDWPQLVARLEAACDELILAVRAEYPSP
jgi:CheY-like chemotaxis protein/HPt (histidine-containing phosphotransfer) domain-containing protein/anti-sigma regulatory factor (Ser/Thr protein kinase)